jgi:hypothetical protein
VKTYKKVLALVPELDEQMDQFIENSGPLQVLTSIVGFLDAVLTDTHLLGYQMTKSAGNTRSDDSGSIRYACVQYIMEDPKTPLEPTIPKQHTKADRGFNHPMLAVMLCPRSFLDTFKANPNK